jgi:hypothetical protein
VSVATIFDGPPLSSRARSVKKSKAPPRGARSAPPSGHWGPGLRRWRAAAPGPLPARPPGVAPMSVGDSRTLRPVSGACDARVAAFPWGKVCAAAVARLLPTAGRRLPPPGGLGVARGPGANVRTPRR